MIKHNNLLVKNLLSSYNSFIMNYVNSLNNLSNKILFNEALGFSFKVMMDIGAIFNDINKPLDKKASHIYDDAASERFGVNSRMVVHWFSENYPKYISLGQKKRILLWSKDLVDEYMSKLKNQIDQL